MPGILLTKRPSSVVKRETYTYTIIMKEKSTYNPLPRVK